jgi:hypothetical protein
MVGGAGGLPDVGTVGAGGITGRGACGADAGRPGPDGDPGACGTRIVGPESDVSVRIIGPESEPSAPDPDPDPPG